MGQIYGLYLKELDQVVKDGEHNDGDDVTETVPHLTLLEGKTDGEKPLDSHSNNTVDTACERYVNDGEGVWGDVWQYPDVVLL